MWVSVTSPQPHPTPPREPTSRLPLWVLTLAPLEGPAVSSHAWTNLTLGAHISDPRDLSGNARTDQVCPALTQTLSPPVPHNLHQAAPHNLYPWRSCFPSYRGSRLQATGLLRIGGCPTSILSPYALSVPTGSSHCWQTHGTP